MTKEENKNAIIQLKTEGLSIKEISTQLDIPLGTVKSILFRINADENKEGVCKNCDKPISSIDGKKAKKFCSDKCRLTWWNNHRNEGHKSVYTKICPNCSQEFTTSNKQMKYCCHSCYIEYRYGKGSGINE